VSTVFRLTGLLTVLCLQVFSAKAVEFREAVSSILGYKLAFQSTRVRLTSMYDLTASIVFDSKSKDDIGTMNIVGLGDGGQGGPPTLKQLMDFWVFERGSIPCFLAALTIECYELSTRGRSAGWVVNDTSSSESMNITQG
jgi:mitotic spindle assembly checkpoint protein MAD1